MANSPPVPETAAPLAVFPPPECLAQLQFDLQVAIRNRWRDVGQEKMLEGLRVAATISLNQTHNWGQAEIDQYLDRWLATCPRPVYVYTACLHKAAMLDLLMRLETPTP